MKTTLSLVPSLLALPKDTAGHLDVLVQLTPPAQPVKADRPSLNLALVVDRSGSMAGAFAGMGLGVSPSASAVSPLEEAKRAAIHLINKLQQGDRVCLVSYGGNVSLDTPSLDAVEGRAQLIAAVERLAAGGGTALREGWLTGAQAIAPFVSQHGISRVLLLSDGQATDSSIPAALAEEARQLMGAGISTSTYGLGFNFNEDLMTQLAQGGQAFYAESAETLVPYFDSEFAMLSATVGRQVQVELTATVGGKSIGVQRLDTAGDLKGPVFLSPLIAGAVTWVALRLLYPSTGAKENLALKAKVSWVDLEGKPHSLEQDLSVPVRAKQKANSDPAVERLKEAEAARLQREALESARRGNWDHTDQILRGLSACAGNNAYISGVAASLSSVSATRDVGLFSKEAVYSSHAMSNRVVDTDEQLESMDGGRFGLRKVSQGKVAETKKEG